MTVVQNQDLILKVFQLRAARVTAGIELKTIGNLLAFTKAAISLWEHKDNFAKLTTSKENIRIMKECFAKRNIFFPDENTITLNDIIENEKSESLTRFQLKAARTILKVSQAKLATLTNVPVQIIARSELLKNNQYMRPYNQEIPMILKKFFESKNIFFSNDLTVSFFRDEKSS